MIAKANQGFTAYAVVAWAFALASIGLSWLDVPLRWLKLSHWLNGLLGWQLFGAMILHVVWLTTVILGFLIYRRRALWLLPSVVPAGLGAALPVMILWSCARGLCF